MVEQSGIIDPHGGFRKLKSFQTAEIVYDATVVFCNRLIDRRARTHGQMVQAARSGKQNIAVRDPQKPFDISRIDFERLRREFERSKAKRTTVQNLKEAIEKRLHALLEKNPLRTDFQRHYEEIVGEFNREKDRLTIEKTFEDLLKFMQGLGEEEARHIREAA